MPGQGRQFAAVRGLVQRVDDDGQPHSRSRSGRATASGCSRSRPPGACRLPGRGRTAPRATGCGPAMLRCGAGAPVRRPCSCAAISTSIWPRKSSASPGRRAGRRAPGRTVPRPRVSPRSAVVGGRVTVVGCGRAGGDEVVAPEADGVEVTLPRRGVGVGEPAEGGDVRAEARPVRVDDVVRPEGRHDACRPSRSVAGRHAAPESRGRRRSWPGTRSATARTRLGVGTRRAARRSHMLVVERVRRLGSQRVVDAQHLGERVLQPELRRCAPEQVEVRGELTPDQPAVDSAGRRAVERSDAQRLHGDALAVQQAHQVVVPRHQLAWPDRRTRRRRRAAPGRSDRAGSRWAAPSSPRTGAGRSSGYRDRRAGVGRRSAR